VPTIALDRRFFEWRDGELSDPDLLARWGRAKDLMPWEDVLTRRRIVLLAEAGSGKTEEMRDQVRFRTAAGQFAMYATVEDVDRDGLEDALGAADRARLTAWRGTDENGWFFIDSVDEARLGRVRLERALRQIADGILGTERRAHIVLLLTMSERSSVHGAVADTGANSRHPSAADRKSRRRPGCAIATTSALSRAADVDCGARSMNRRAGAPASAASADKIGRRST
jgi:hypothetical protein